MSILEDLRFLITRTNVEDSLNRVPSVYLTANSKKPFLFSSTDRYILYSSIAVLGTLFYILYPSFPTAKNKSIMFSKRPDKHTTGLINLRNDCFANSSVQAYSALPGLTEYLNKFIGTYRDTIKQIDSLGIDLDTVITSDDLEVGSHSRFKFKEEGDGPAKPKDHFKINLHIALAKIMKKLQATQLTSRTISVWTFLHELERIYSAKISRSQHDAHELTQLINETLETENLLCIRILKKVKDSCSSNIAMSEALASLEFPDFPFNGLTLSQMKCLSCSHVSKPNITPFLMLTLHPPQETSTDLETLLDDNESETINGYQCLKCRLLRIVENEKEYTSRGNKNPPNEQEFINKLQELNENDGLFINEDLPTDLENYVKEYNKMGLDISSVTSNVFRKTQILKPPKVFGIHLSRSAFNGVTISRNPCRVSFNDKLSLSIDDEHLATLQKFQEYALNGELSKSSMKVLTTDVNDMEDENVQREDIDELGEDDEKSDLDDSTNTEDESTDSDDTDTGTVYSESTVPPSLDTAATAPQSDTVDGMPYTKDQTMSLLRHFHNFKFHDNNVYKYRLKAVIRHQGSHTQGHYECYKRKPLFVKDSEGSIIKLSPEIDDDYIQEVEDILAKPVEGTTSKPRSSSSSSDASWSSEESNKGNFRRKLSMMIGRRPSIVQADPEEANVHEIIDSGLTTPAEVLVDGGDYFHLNARDVKEQLNNMSASEHQTSRVKMKKIPSIIKFPFWRIGDAQVSEVSRSAVLFETSSVYMLYYERIDRKQIKR
ncbi:hypothetical protein CLUG_03258 [Clavispora lusitaniae ATCC 42720]|uniref:USP domain-containing protein n=2 Tax=Clavispora lusitaniae TaxID=36911 RepID=C4Y524_CLAL4|nr:uncharacterized protein CLUG_03258 [Clavispora lusitaniae ATCC 42720]EEQ39130.1 hypothetical protein CLUG_03258 [Clavispora lusitaniae ATCC 42720]